MENLGKLKGKSSPNMEKYCSRMQVLIKTKQKVLKALARFTIIRMFLELLSVNFIQLEENVWVNNSSFPYNIFF